MDFRVVAINKANADAFERVFGGRPRAGDLFLDLLSHVPEQQEINRQLWTRALAGETFMITREFGDPGREKRTFEARFDIVRDRAGKQIGAVSTSYDVTDRVRAEAELGSGPIDVSVAI